ncbi:helix-turn-helix transcriptional regulator [Bradyrhizobium sp. BR 10289]|uniref:helix-turn-helix domain-containing protein n=1 Tax=Bradyrhizobium sp. BR 10289 TaxID=2749993 RepID=UPI001C651BF4|nr:helix-turn-helix transcriptional regulator [Bradyrhizobium sp. BR 10289]MBW7968139.1 helix-turn-helix transcriptional regulator [Bradyrhizobium sp. BR 10289]
MNSPTISASEARREASRSRAARMKHIRSAIFRITQIEMAEIAGVEQPTVSRWEKGTHEPSLTNLERIRAEAVRRGLAWDDGLFFGSAGHPVLQNHVSGARTSTVCSAQRDSETRARLESTRRAS